MTIDYFLLVTRVLHWFFSGFFVGTGAMLAYALYAEIWGRVFPGLHKIMFGTF